MPSIGEAIGLAWQHYQSGNFSQAAALYQQVLTADPQNADAANGLGIIMAMLGKPQEAIGCFQFAVQVQPSNASFHSNLGIVLATVGRHQEAAASHNQALRLDSGQATIHNNLGSVLNTLGRYDEALSCFLEAVRLAPDYAEAHHNIGIVYAQQDRHVDALDAFAQTLRLKPGFVDALFNRGNLLLRLGRLSEAQASYKDTLRHKPDHADACNNLGSCLAAEGKLEDALRCFLQASRQKPELAEALQNAGTILNKLGRPQEAINCLRQALQIRPDHWETLHELGQALLAIDSVKVAIGCYEEGVRVHPNHAEAHFRLAIALLKDDKVDESIACHRRALDLNPNHSAALNSLAMILKDKGEGEAAEAMRLMHRAVAAQPGNADILCQLGLFYEHQKQLDEAISCYSKALELQPNHIAAPCGLAMAWLLKGDYERGWLGFESRFLLWPHLKRDFAQPQWKGTTGVGEDEGEDLTILLHAEGGFGDALQFVRYVPMVAARVGRVVLECPKPLEALFARVFPMVEIVVRGEPLPRFDLHSPLQSLPRAFGTKLDTVPAAVPYLHADASSIEFWRIKLLAERAAYKVGLVWAGGERNPDLRRCPLQTFAPLATVPGVVLYSLQKGNAASQASAPPAGMRLIDWTAQLDDFSDTAALVANLDLVITVDTAVCHLAGAMAKPVWTLIPCAADFRWLVDGTHTPWYPTMRLIRQARFGEWISVFERMASELGSNARAWARTQE